MRAHPHLYEINTWPWLDALSRRAGRHLTLGRRAGPRVGRSPAPRHRHRLSDGHLEASAFGRQLARSEPSLTRAFDRALPDWTARDVVGSAYCIAAYEPDPRIGTWDDLAGFRARLHARGMLLMVDFIPNHTGFDHPWVASHPDRYVQGDEAAFRNNPGAFRAIETPSGDVRFIACGRDPVLCAVDRRRAARLLESRHESGDDRRARATRQACRRRTMRHGDARIVHRPSSIVHRPSSIVHRPSSIVHRPSSIVHRPSSVTST